MPLKAIIFDFDGVIIDSETPEYHSWQQVCRHFDVDIPLDVWEKGMGSSLDAFNPLVYLEQCLGKPVDRPTLLAEQRQLLWEVLGSQPPLPGIQEYLHCASQKGLKVAIASSSSRDWVRGNLERLNLLSYFHVLCNSDDVLQVKPDPALYLLALERLGVSAEDAMAIEDSPNGVRAARDAGIFCVAVPTPVSGLLDLSQANLVLSSLAALPFEDLEAQYFS
jgi:HAD superfamily hydrolase (TIGR01509 family)